MHLPCTLKSHFSLAVTKVFTERPWLYKERISISDCSMVNMNEIDKSVNDSLEALFDEGALLYYDETLPEAGKTPTTPVQGAHLAATVDGGKASP